MRVSNWEENDAESNWFTICKELLLFPFGLLNFLYVYTLHLYLHALRSCNSWNKFSLCQSNKISLIITVALNKKRRYTSLSFVHIVVHSKYQHSRRLQLIDDPLSLILYLWKLIVLRYQNERHRALYFRSC